MAPARGEGHFQIIQQGACLASRSYIIESKGAILGLDQHNLVHTRILLFLFYHFLSRSCHVCQCQAESYSSWIMAIIYAFFFFINLLFRLVYAYLD